MSVLNQSATHMTTDSERDGSPASPRVKRGEDHSKASVGDSDKPRSAEEAEEKAKSEAGDQAGPSARAWTYWGLPAVGRDPNKPLMDEETGWTPPPEPPYDNMTDEDYESLKRIMLRIGTRPKTIELAALKAAGFNGWMHYKWMHIGSSLSDERRATILEELG